MPIYEYRCRDCGATNEYLMGLGDDTAPVCKGCGSPDMERILSVASFMDGGSQRGSGMTCCGREERCDTPPCSGGTGCRRG